MKRCVLSEYLFGTIKRLMGAIYFLLRGLRKVTGEVAFFCLEYNIERIHPLFLGFGKMMELMLGTEASFLLKYVFIMRAMTQGEKEA
ncbi:hypothetical protein DXB04_25155 [Enterocloster bolteae]|nr:hypothetical protein DXB04_25155 [Enterocloster bolteae]